MSTLILPRSISRSNAADNDMADERQAEADYHAHALKAGIDRTVTWAKTPPIFEPGDEIIVVRMPGRERVIHKRPDRSNQSGMKVRVYDVTTPRPCPGCTKPIYGIGEVQTATAPWHLACWEMEQALREMAGELSLTFDAEGLPVVEGKGRGRPRRRSR